MSTIYLSAVRRMLPRAQIAVDLFHVIHLANNTVADVRGAPSGASTAAAAAPGTLSTESRTCSHSNLEDLTGDQFAKIIGTLPSTQTPRDS